MEWGLFVLALVFVAVLQLVVWRRLQSGDVGVTDNAASRERGFPTEMPVTDEDEERTVSDPDVTLCPECGSENETGYKFCRECVEMLHA